VAGLLKGWSAERYEDLPSVVALAKVLKTLFAELLHYVYSQQYADTKYKMKFESKVAQVDSEDDQISSVKPRSVEQWSEHSSS
jgi:hypothetical protein